MSPKPVSRRADHKKLQRTQNLVKLGAASQQEEDDVAADHAAHEAHVRSALERLKLLGASDRQIAELKQAEQINANLVVPAPINGVVLTRTANLGLVTNTSQELFTVADLSTVWVMASINEKDFSTIHIGTSATVTAPAYPGRAWISTQQLRVDCFERRLALRNMSKRRPCHSSATMAIVHWGGARLRDFFAAFPPRTVSRNQLHRTELATGIPKYVGFETPDGQYHVGIEREVALHPQTLLAYELNGQPMTPDHGAPLRLVTPLKYGIKQLKQIGRMTYTDMRPRDYWHEQGYDYYAGL